MSKIYHSSNQWALTGLFKRIKLGEDPKLLQNEAGHLAEKVDANDIAAAKQALIDEGYPGQLVQKISATFVLMGLRKEKIRKEKPNLADNHIVQKILIENSLTRCYLADLEQIAEQIDSLDTLTDVSSEFRRLSFLVEYFVETRTHLDREDDLIFPYLVKYGWQGLCRTSKQEHKKIRFEIDHLTALVMGFDTFEFENFKALLPKIVKRLCPFILEHLSYEEKLLWPIALIVVDDERAWETIKALSDEIGY